MRRLIAWWRARRRPSLLAERAREGDRKAAAGGLTGEVGDGDGR